MCCAAARFDRARLAGGGIRHVAEVHGHRVRQRQHEGWKGDGRRLLSGAVARRRRRGRGAFASSRPIVHEKTLDGSMAAVTDSAGAALERLLDIMRTLRAPDGCPGIASRRSPRCARSCSRRPTRCWKPSNTARRPTCARSWATSCSRPCSWPQISDEAGRVLAARRARRHLRQAGPPASPRVRARARAPRASRATRWSSAGTRSRRANGRWRAAPAQPRGAAKGALSGVPKTLPALLRAFELSSRAATVGFDWAGPGDVLDKLDEEVAEVRQRGAVGRARPPVARRRRGRRPAVRGRQPGAQARRRARVGAAPRQREVRAAVRCRGARACGRRDVRSATPRSKRWKPSGSGSSARTNPRPAAAKRLHPHLTAVAPHRDLTVGVGAEDRGARGAQPREHGRRPGARTSCRARS